MTHHMNTIQHYLNYLDGLVNEKINIKHTNKGEKMRIPYTNFKTRTGDDNAIGGCAFIGGKFKDVDTVEMFDNKKIVVFALPGAFTPTCSSEQLPGYEELYDDIKAQGVDEVYCL